MFIDERQDFFLMVYLTFTYAAITRMYLQIKDPECRQQKVQNWDAPWEKGKNNDCMGGFR